MKNTLQKIKKYNTGETLAEVILSIAIFAIAATAVILLITSSFHGSLVGGSSTQATALARESFEAVRSVGKNSYNQLSSGVYGLTHASGTWAFVDTPDSNGIFTRSVTVSDVYRDASGNISTSTFGTKDINTRKITATLSWPGFIGTKRLSFVNYFTNWDSINMSQMQGGFGGGLFGTTKLTSAVSTSSPTSSVQLTTANSKFWKCALVQGVVDYPGTTQGTAIATYGNYAFMTLKHNTTGEFSVINKKDSKNPYIVTSIDIGNDDATSVIISPSGNYAYVGTSGGNLITINVATPSATSSIGIVNTLPMPSNTSINKLAISSTGNFVYVATVAAGGGGTTKGRDFYVVSLATPSAPAFPTGGNLGIAKLGPNVISLVTTTKNNKYVYAVTDDSTKKLMVIDVSTSSSPALATSTNFSGSVPSDVAIYDSVASSTLYIVTSNSAGSAGEFFEVDVSSSTKPTPTFSLNLGNGALSVAAEGTNAIIGTQTANKKTLQVVDTAPITTDTDGNDVPVIPAQPVIVLSITLSKFSYNAVYWDANDKLLYAVTSDANAELQIINRSGKINWGCMIRQSIINLPGNTAGLSVFSVGNQLYIGTAKNNSKPEFYIYDVTDQTAPTIPVAPGTTEIGAAVNGIAAAGGFAFLATGDSNGQLKVVDVSDTASPSLIASYSPAGVNTPATAVGVNNGNVLVAIGSTLYKLTVDGNGNLTFVGSTQLAGAATKIVFYNLVYAYVTTASNNDQIQVIQYDGVPMVVNSISLGSNGNGTGLWLKGKWLLVGSDNAAGNDFFTFDVSGAGAPPNAPTSTIGTLNLGSKVTSLAASPDENFAFAGVNINGQEMKTIDLSGLLSTTTAPFISASSTENTLNGFINDMYFSRDTNSIFLGTNDTGGESYIYGEIPGFAGFNTQYATNGTYTEFPVTDAGQNVNWNIISWTFSTSTGCSASSSASIKMQVKSSTLNDLAFASQPFEGPDGTDLSFYTDKTGSLLNTDNNAHRYIQYMGTLVSDTTCTPYLTSVTFNYTK